MSKNKPPKTSYEHTPNGSRGGDENICIVILSFLAIVGGGTALTLAILL